MKTIEKTTNVPVNVLDILPTKNFGRHLRKNQLFLKRVMEFWFRELKPLNTDLTIRNGQLYYTGKTISVDHSLPFYAILNIRDSVSGKMIDLIHNTNVVEKRKFRTSAGIKNKTPDNDKTIQEYLNLLEKRAKDIQDKEKEEQEKKEKAANYRKKQSVAKKQKKEQDKKELVAMMIRNINNAIKVSKGQ